MFGKSAIEKSLFDSIREIFPDGSKILEFGSGEGTSELLKHYRVTSIEHNEKYFFTREGEHNIFLARLADGWYDTEMVKLALQKAQYDLILIDGPPGKLRANIDIELFRDIDCPVIFDDVNRQIDKEAMICFCEKLGYDHVILKGDSKYFAICFKLKS